MRTKPTIRIGDLVKLNSGGPLMTVTSYEESIYEKGRPNKRRFRCYWFDEKGRHHGAMFPLAALTKEVKPEPDTEALTKGEETKSD